MREALFVVRSLIRSNGRGEEIGFLERLIVVVVSSRSPECKTQRMGSSWRCGVGWSSERDRPQPSLGDRAKVPSTEKLEPLTCWQKEKKKKRRIFLPHHHTLFYRNWILRELSAGFFRACRRVARTCPFSLQLCCSQRQALQYLLASSS